MDKINGIINFDKPSNYDSHQVTALIKKFLKVEKIGHSGTLDPKVTGVLPILIGKATRLAEYFLKSDKEYIGVMYLHKEIGVKKLREIIKKKFIGKIKQIPPVRSAVRRQKREREIYNFKIIEKKDKNVLFKVHCESGTYIRKLIHDLGQEKEVRGAHMLELRRTKEGIFDEKDSVNVYDLLKAIKNKKLNDIILPIEIITKNMPKIIVKNSILTKLYNGSPVFKEFILKKDKFKGVKEGDLVAVLCNKKLIEIAQAISKKDTIAIPKTVIK